MAALLAEYEPRIPDAAEFALANRVLLLQTKEGTGIDIALAGLPFEEQAVERASEVEYGKDVFLRTCSAEDLIVMKAFAGRPTDWHDISSICIRQGRDALVGSMLSRSLLRCEIRGTPALKERGETGTTMEASRRNCRRLPPAWTNPLPP